MSLAVCCFYWTDPQRQRNYSFTHDHVRILRNMVARNLSVPHRFVCVTDDRIEGVETVPLDWRSHVPGTCGLKLQWWKPDFGEIVKAERILGLDLDLVVTGGLDPVVDRPEDVVLFRNPNFSLERRRAFYQGSVQLFRAGARPQVWTEIFRPGALAQVNGRFGGFEQAWLSEVLPWTEAYWDSFDGIYGAGRLGDVKPGVATELPENARIVVFPGNRLPDQSEVQRTHPWVKDHYR